MSKKILLSEVARFQSIAGLRSMSSLKEDMDMEESMDMEEDMEMDEDSDYMGAETIEDEPVNELDGDTMEVMKQIALLASMTGGLMGLGKAFQVFGAKEIMKKDPSIDYKQAKKKALQQMTQGVERATGGGDRPGPTDSMGVKL
jgi:hypothetical protein